MAGQGRLSTHPRPSARPLLGEPGTSAFGIKAQVRLGSMEGLADLVGDLLE